jgi:hypothetical protein
MWFTVAELDSFDLPWTAEHVMSRGRDRTGEYVDLIFRFDWRLYHVLMHLNPDGTHFYPEAMPIEGDSDLWVDCNEVELYATRRPEILFRKVSADAAI